MTEDLIKGAAKFRHYHYESGHENLMAELVKAGQDPKYFIISCIDSRCNPGTIFRAKPGIFFAHKAMGAIVRPYKQGTALAAALQFALNYNKVETIIILGHTGCGAIKALVDNLEDSEISSFINVAKHAHAKAQSCCDTQETIINRTEQEVVLESAQNLHSYPCVQDALRKQKITIKSWQFDIKTGHIKEYDESSQKFITLTLDSKNINSRQES